MHKLSLVVPVYNERGAIKAFIADLQGIMQKINVLSEVIAVDDCSDDGTADILKTSDMKVLTHSEHLGYGAAIKTGIDKSDGDIICIIDADNTYKPDDIRELIKYIELYDMVVGARIKTRLFPFYQRIAKGLVCLLLSAIFRQNIPDINSGLRIIKKEIVEKYHPVLPNGFSFTASITLAMLLGGYRIKYVPVNYFRRVGKSKIDLLKYTINFIKNYWRIMYYCKFKK